MKFYSDPGHIVNERKLNRATGKWKNNVLFVFDKNGEYETDNESLIEKLKPHFKYENNATSEEININKRRSKNASIN